MSFGFGFFRKTVTVKTEAPGSYVNGFWQAGVETEIEIQASVQPASANDVAILPEGRRLAGSFRLFTSSRLHVAVSGFQSDRVVIDGDDYEVMAESVWENGLVPHYSYLVTRVVEQVSA